MRTCTLLIVLWLTACANLSAQPTRTAVMSAFHAELEPLLSQVENPQTHDINGLTFTTGQLAGHEVVLIPSGVSMVNAAMTTQMLFDHFDVSHLLYTGIAGSLNPQRRIGDVVAPRFWGQHQQSVYAREIDGVFVPPEWASTDYGSFGMIIPQPVQMRGEQRFWFEADPAMRSTAAALTLTLESCSQDAVCLDYTPMLTVGGRGLSGQAFVDNAAFRDYAFTTFEADVVDMESAAVAQVAAANGIPFLIFRGISDLAGGEAEQNAIDRHYRLAINNAAAAVIAYLEHDKRP